MNHFLSKLWIIYFFHEETSITYKTFVSVIEGATMYLFGSTLLLCFTFAFQPFVFFFLIHAQQILGDNVLFMYCLCGVYRSHDTIHTLKNYFTTVFSVFSFSFSKNKLYPNGSIWLKKCYSCKKEDRRQLDNANGMF